MMNRFGLLATIVFLCCGFACAQSADLFSENGVFMAPIRPIVHWLGGTVMPDANGNRITLQLGNTTVKLSPNGEFASVSGKAITLEMSPIERDGLLYVPVSFISDALKVQLAWNPAHTKLAIGRPASTEKLVLSTLPISADEMTAVFTAVASGGLQKVTAAVQEHPTLVYQRQHGRTLLAAAVEAGKVDLVKYLLGHDADPQQTFFTAYTLPPESLTLMHLAAGRGSVELVELLAKYGVSIETATTGTKLTPLCYCLVSHITGYNDQETLATVETLLRKGANPNAAMSYPAGMQVSEQDKAMQAMPGFGTPLMWAVLGDNQEVEALLLKYGAKPISAELRAQLIQQTMYGRMRARQTECVSHLRQMAVAAMMWTQEHEEILPTSAIVWTSMRNDLAQAIFKCSADAQHANGYGFNAALSGKGLGEIDDPSKMLLFADCKSADNLIRSLDDIDQNRHGEGYFAAFVDGHVEFIKAGTPVKLK